MGKSAVMVLARPSESSPSGLDLEWSTCHDSTPISLASERLYGNSVVLAQWEAGGTALQADYFGPIQTSRLPTPSLPIHYTGHVIPTSREWDGRRVFQPQNAMARSHHVEGSVPTAAAMKVLE